MMKHGKLLILIDCIINLFLGVVLLSYSNPVVRFFGLPETEVYFYPNILGAVLFGIGIALLIEFRRKHEFAGLGLGGAIVINLVGGVVLFLWLIWGELDIPMQGTVILWILDFVLVGISALELYAFILMRETSEDKNFS